MIQFEEMLYLQEIIAIVSWKLVDKTYEELRQLYHLKYKKQSQHWPISGYLWKWAPFNFLRNALDCIVRFWFVFHDNFHPSNYWFIWFVSQVDPYWPIFCGCFSIFHGIVGTNLHTFYHAVARKRWLSFALNRVFFIHLWKELIY